MAKYLCGFLNLQAGVVILAFCFIAIATIVLIVNLHLIGDFPAGLVLVLCFILVLATASAAMIVAAYKENRRWCLVSLAFVLVVVVMFLVGSCVSFANKPTSTRYVCVENRCPETLWLAPLMYRRLVVHSGTDGTDCDDPTEPMRTTAQGTEEEKNTEPRELTQESASTTTAQGIEEASTTTPLQQETYYEDVELNSRVMTEAEYVIGPAFYAAVALFIVNFIFFVFCAYSIFSYYQELTHIFRSHPYGS